MSEQVTYPRLATFPPGGYDKGRSIFWQVAWTVFQNLVFVKWWFPRRFRPAALRMFGATIGTGIVFRHHVRVQWPWKLTIGDDTWIGEDAWLYNVEPITIGHDVCLSQGAFVCTGSHDHNSSDFHCTNKPIVIEDGAWLCAQSLVLAGVTVGTGAVVGARAIAFRDVAPGASVRVGTVS
ncbi:acetyltransferase [Aeromicrobium sp. Root236]|uniref:DapH/DapD/GlmU-related protein n=1 Tax=Aeromicrobium sp. Root236 TaxID=1736498 RepID=UPI0006FBD47F|nr:DapH/DapD/GlmU-related protein [Aeromicrobium sp. Root236]KRC65746.1 acetyltransferase [Aeromicrobium sp. Root236]